jgi:Domain of unknown function (DUF4157)
VFADQQTRAQSTSKAPLLSDRLNRPSASPAQRLPQSPGGHGSFASWNFNHVPLYSPGQNSIATPWSSGRSSRSGPAIGGEPIDLGAIHLQSLRPERTRDAMQADGSLEDLSDDQDSLTPSTFERKSTGRGVHVRVNGGHPGATPEYSDGIRWIQTIETNKPLGGQTSPYVDFAPPADDKPFYFSDAMEASYGGKFSDNPSRSANGIRWDATLSLAGVSGRTVTRIDSVNYGFDIDASGVLSLHGPSSTGTADVVIQGDTLRSEYPDWIFSGGFAVPQVPAPGGPGGSGLLQASRDGVGSNASSQPAGQQRQSTGISGSDAAPPIVTDVLRSPGEPLHRETRDFMESRFRHDFSRIRVHADAVAAESAAAVGASAYTVGNHVVFGQKQYRPGTLGTQWLLAHELRHTQQQGEVSATGPLMVAPPNTDFERDADETARRAASDELGAGPEIPRTAPRVQRQPSSQPEAPGQLRLPQVGESLRKPPLPLFPIPEIVFHLSARDHARIESFLALHHLAVGDKFQPSLDGNPTTIGAITDALLPSILPLISRNEIEDAVRAQYSILVHDALFRITINIPDTPVPDFTATVPGAPDAPETAAPITLTAGTNVAWHVNLTGPRGTSSDKTLQLQVGEDAPLQRIFQISYNLDNQQVQVVIGGQATKDVTLVKDWLKLSGFVQVLAGVAWTGTPASGMLTVVQPSAGGQLTATWKGVQFAVQAAASVTGVKGQPTTAEINVTPQITIPFGSGSAPSSHKVNTSELTGVFEVRDWVDSAGYSEIGRLPTDEKSRLVRILFGGTVIYMDVDSISRIWRACTPGEQGQIKHIIEAEIPMVGNPELQKRLQRLITEG